jgi:hypothetical protein
MGLDSRGSRSRLRVTLLFAARAAGVSNLLHIGGGVQNGQFFQVFNDAVALRQVEVNSTSRFTSIMPFVLGLTGELVSGHAWNLEVLGESGGRAS